MSTLKHITVEEVYNLFITDCVTIPKNAKIYEAIKELLKVPTANSLYVLDDNNNVIGTVLLRDLIRVSSARYKIHKTGIINWFRYLRDIMKKDVEDIMRHPLVIRKDQSLDKALKIMEDYGLNELPVVDKQGRLLGEINGVEILNFCVEAIKTGDMKDSEIEKEWQRMMAEKEKRKKEKEEDKRKNK
jgi:CBS domain-containing protein